MMQLKILHIVTKIKDHVRQIRPSVAEIDILKKSSMEIESGCGTMDSRAKGTRLST